MARNTETIEQDKKLWIPPWVEQEDPTDGDHDEPDPGGDLDLENPRGIERATEEEMREEIRLHGRITREPEIGRFDDEPTPHPRAVAGGMGYADDYPTHFDFRPDVAALVRRIQAKFPWLLFSNTYRFHPPVHGRTYELVSVDRWMGGIVNGRYAGYRGKPLEQGLGTRVFNAIFNAPGRPHLYWIIYRGRMWTRGYGWGPSPWGPAGSDARHDWHIHETYVL